MKRFLLMWLVLVANAVQADTVLLMQFGEQGRTIRGTYSHIVTSGRDGSIEIDSVYDDTAAAVDVIVADGFDARGATGNIDAGNWNWTLKSKGGTETGSAVCVGHTETNTQLGSDGTFIWLECVAGAGDATR